MIRQEGMPHLSLNRRQWMSAAMGLTMAGAARGESSPRVALARCETYGFELEAVLRRMFDQLGGLSHLVSGKTVAIKINMTGSADIRLGHLPAELTYWTHPRVIAAVTHLLGLAGARRIRILESFARGTLSLGEQMILAGWDPDELLNAAPRVEAENTGFLGQGKRYHRRMVPWGGYIYPGFDLNHAYDECDVFVSIAKLKEHVTAGITLTMKNLFGMAPPTIYGNGAARDEPAVVPRGGRTMFHTGFREPSRSAPRELHPGVSKDPGYRVPRIVTDLVGARPIHLAIVDGIETMTAGEGPWVQQRGLAKIRHIRPGVLIAGLNSVSTDAVGVAVMGFDPRSRRGTAPFETCASTIRLAEAKGIGIGDLDQIEVAGQTIRSVRYPFRA